MTTQFPLGPWTEAGNSVYAQTPQNVDHSHFRGLNEKEEHNGEEVGYLIAESIWCDATRNLITAAPDLLDALNDLLELVEVMDEANDPATDLYVSRYHAKLAIARAMGVKEGL